MKFTKENLSQGLTPEYISACKSLDMFMRNKFGGNSYSKGAISEGRNTYWFAPPFMEGYMGGGYSWASTHKNSTFGIVFCYWGNPSKDIAIEAKIPCDKLQWEIRELD